MDTQYKISRKLGLQFALMERIEGEPEPFNFRTISLVSKNSRVNGKFAKECTDDELIADWKNGGKGWSLSL